MGVKKRFSQNTIKKSKIADFIEDFEFYIIKKFV